MNLIPTEKKNYWSGIWALAFGVSAIMIGEFLPAGLLTPMAEDLNITEGAAGQTVTITSFFAVVASIFSAYVTKKFDRKYVLLGFSFFTILSGVIVGASSDYALILFGRILLGIALGSFWSMATAIAIRIVEDKNLTKALSIIFASASFAAMLAAPLGSFLGEIIGWRNVFYLNAIVGLFGFTWILFSMPNLNPDQDLKLKSIVEVFLRSSVRRGLLAIGLSFCGRFATLTYLRPYLENTVILEGFQISLMFLLFDLAYFVGSLSAPKIVEKKLKKAMILSPLALGLVSFAMIFSGGSLPMSTVLIFLLGYFFLLCFPATKK